MGLLDSINRIDNEVDTQTDLIAQIGVALEGKAGAGTGIVPTGTKEITANGEYDVTAYAKANVNVPSGTPDTVEQATPAISVSSSGKITATATQTAGYVAGGTKTATKQLTTKGATTITPSSSVQTAVSAGTYVTGDIKVAAVSGGGGSDVGDIQYCMISNYYASIQAPASEVVYFYPGWTWGDFIASAFNKYIPSNFGSYNGKELYRANSASEQPSAMVTTIGSYVYDPSKKRFLTNSSVSSSAAVTTSDSIIPGHTYHWG